MDGEPLSEQEREQILREAPARLSLYLFDLERNECHPTPLADQFLGGYLDGCAGAPLERAVLHRGLTAGTAELAAFAFGWCRGRADISGYRPTYAHVEKWLSRRGALPIVKPDGEH